MAVSGTGSSPLVAGGVAVALALVVAGVWCGRAPAPAELAAVEATVAVRITPHDEQGVPGKPSFVREPARVRSIVEALGVDRQPALACPPDYTTAELGLLLTGRDVYGRRSVYVWDLMSDGGAPTVVVVSPSGCRGGAPSDAALLRREIGRLPDAGR